ncbi:unnamed protein product [Miscanthus lutarioriparius]|uniref:Uncharacterized protein n=1 Tax=Miscanthus lutarioriparius TaxID=422564 RepID=A0A811PE99_9POAL|nr:unnamed protein product [Miscanthus lutarioriparius]
MKRGASESDATSQATTTPPRTPKTPNNKRPAYYVQSPSHDGGGDKSLSSTTAHTTPVYNSPLESPSHASSTGRHSRVSSATRFSGTLLPSSSPATSRASAGAGRKKRHGGGSGHKHKKWREVGGVIDEEAADEYDGVDQEEEEEDELPVCCAVVLCAVVLVLRGGLVRRRLPRRLGRCSPLQTHRRRQEPDSAQLLRRVRHGPHRGADEAGHAQLLAGHVRPQPFHHVRHPRLLELHPAHFHKFYQPRKSHRVAAAIQHGEKTPLYGAGATLAVANDAGGKGKVPLTLELAVRTRGHVIGRLVRVKHAVRVRCPVAIDPGSSRPVRFRRSDCSYRRR